MDDQTKTTSTSTSALAYAATRGWFVFPAPPGEKKSHKSAEHSNGQKWGMTNDQDQIKKDWEKWPEANVGLPTGKANGFWVVEADTKAGHNVDGIASLVELEKKHGPLPKTLMAESPSGSLHYYFKWIDGIEIKNSASRIGPGIDVRGEGGMVIAPPSVRKDGVYKWLNDLEIAEAPQWLIAAAIEAAKRTAPKSGRPRTADLERLRAALKVIPNDDLGWEEWNNIGMAIFNSTGGSDEGLKLFHEWSKKSKKYNSDATDSKWEAFRKTPPTSISAGTIFYLANEAKPGWDSVSVDDFHAYMPDHSYIFVPTGERWPVTSVNSRLPSLPMLKRDGTAVLDAKGNPKRIKPSSWLDKHRPVEQMTWAPGEPQIIEGRLIADGGWIDRPGVSAYNLYRPPAVGKGNSANASRWVNLVYRIYPDDGDHIVAFFAQRVQKPEIKINHGILLGGFPGIGKDTILEPVKHAVGPWNFREVSPHDIMGAYNDYMRSVVLRVSEVHDLGEVSRYAFHDHMKIIQAAPPDVIRVNGKYIPQHYVQNITGVIKTTNYRYDAIYIPANDRREYVAWSEVEKEDFKEGFWKSVWDWYQSEGLDDVAAYLREYDLSKFDPKAPPKQTDAFWQIVGVNSPPEESELADALDAMGKKAGNGQIIRPVAVTIGGVMEEVKMKDGNLYEWLKDNKNKRNIPRRFEACGYVPVHNKDAKDNRWIINGKRQIVYGRLDVAPSDRISAARELTKGS